MLWKSVPCEVHVFNLTDDAESDHPFGAEVNFRFQIDGKNHQTNRLGIAGWKDARDQLREWQRFKLDETAKCYLPNGDTGKAVLFRPAPKWGGIAFVVFSGSIGSILYQAHRGRYLPTDELGVKVLPAVGILFGGAGMFMLLALSMPVWIETLQARSWEEKPAKIVWGKYRVNRGAKGRTVTKADICYEYETAGKAWRNNSLYPGGLNAGNFDHAAMLLAAHPPGSAVTCRVDPKRPERAVLFASPGWSVVWTLFPFPFLALGGLVLKSIVRSDAKSRR